jgi:hypothetical protein
MKLCYRVLASSAEVALCPSACCTHLAMEATGVDWKPGWNILSDGDFELVLANATHIKNVPSRKTDASDAAWIADLLAHGLIRSSFSGSGAPGIVETVAHAQAVEAASVCRDCPLLSFFRGQAGSWNLTKAHDPST